MLRAALALLLSGVSLGSAAQCNPNVACCSSGGGGATCGGSGVASLGNGSGTNQGAGNPIHVVTGNKYQQEIDLPALPGVLGLEIVRHYNSVESGAYSRNGILGRGWKLSYETELFVRGASVEIVQADGGAITFRREEGVSHYRSANAAQGMVSAHRTSRGDEHVWRWPDGRQLSFDADGKLVQIALASGEFVSLARDPQGWLVGVTDPQGRSLRLNYLDRRTAAAEKGLRFTGVQSIDTPVGRFRYVYGSEAAPGVAAPSVEVDPSRTVANLVKVDLPTHHDALQKVHDHADRGVSSSSVSRHYHYEDARSPTLLTGISVVGSGSDGKLMAQRIATYRYDATGRGVLSVRGEPRESNEDGVERAGSGERGIEQVTFKRRPGESVVTNSLGQTTLYRHATIAGEPRLLEVRGASCASCGPSNVRHGYDAQGRLISTTTLGRDGEPLRERRTTPDVQGRPLRVERIDYAAGKPLPPQWLLRYEYGEPVAAAEASGLQLHAMRPTLIARPSVVVGREHRLLLSYNAAGQPLRITEEGYSPVDEGGRETPLGTAITRSIDYRYETINGRSLLAEVDGPLPNGPRGDPADSDVTRLEWDERGRFIVSMTSPGGFVNRMQHDAAGRPAVLQSPDGIETRLRYDPIGRLAGATTTGPGWEQPLLQSYLRDALGRLVETGAGDAESYRGKVRHGYDVADRRIWSASALGLLQQRRIDSEGKTLESSLESASLRRASRFEYDEYNRLVAVSDSAGGSRRIAYGVDDLPRFAVDSLGRETRYRYDAHLRPLEFIAAANAIQLPLQDTTVRFVRDATEAVDTVVAANGAATRSLRDDFGRIVATISGDSGRTTREFDAADRLMAARDANGNRARYEYDAVGRIARQTLLDAHPHSGTPSVTNWTYDGTRLVAIDHPVQHERYLFDEQGRVAGKTVLLETAEGRTLNSVTRYEYDAQGRPSAMSLPDGSVVRYRRNGQGQVVALVRERIATPWLAWLLPGEILVQDIERDLAGLSRYRYGNGVEAEFRRSRSGVLAQLRHRTSGSVSRALIDHRYLWDTEGNLLHDRGLDQTLQYAYDAQDRLIVAAARAASKDSSTAAKVDAPPDGLIKTGMPAGRPALDAVEHYFYDGVGNRLLSQEPQASLPQAATVRVSHEPNSNRWRGDSPVERDGNGQPTRIGSRSYVWDGFGRLDAVHQQGRTLARYRYNHRGERVAKIVSPLGAKDAASVGARAAREQGTHYLYEDRRLQAELNEHGKIVRQYVYLGEQPIAVIDTPSGVELAGVERSAWEQFRADLARVFQVWSGAEQGIVFLHHNHLGAPELATDSSGAAIWRARYSAFGKATAILSATGSDAAESSPAFTLNLRLPGQYADVETGLHYNDHRYYDPAHGRYLTPDPLGLRGGLNGYAYAAGNPLKYIDPSGLILFAFDGTGNSAQPPSGDTISNVRKFLLAYDEELNGPAFYITGIGTVDEHMPYRGSVISGDGFDQRVQLGFGFLDRFINSSDDSSLLQIDAVGFSRGAAEARVWVNLLVAAMQGGAYTTQEGKSRCLNLRFEGLWDTVPHLGIFNERERRYDFGIPIEMNYAAHAVALNEHRGGLANFNLRSILDMPATSSGGNRNEMGFVGSHSDIGGGYGTGDLSNVALMWMIEQARLQGIQFKDEEVRERGWSTVSNPIVHDKSTNKIDPSGVPEYEDRYVVYGGGEEKKQREAMMGGNDTEWARSLVSYYEVWCGPRSSPAVGVVDMGLYHDWLRGQGVSSLAFVTTKPHRSCN